MAVDRKKAIDDLSQIKVKGNEEGLIPAFGVLVQFLPANFWNTFTEKMLMSVDDRHLEEVETGLERAAGECGYHTGWGIINSEEFKAIVGPMIEKMPEDVLHGAYAVFSAWGWAKCEIVELDPGRRKVVRAYEYYESKISETLTVKKPCAYMIRGVTRAFMDIAYGATYPDGYGTFKCEQVKAMELGDSYGEFVVTRK
jgi:CRISPR/Cas system CSM-associated protein Csm2 small subunit